MKSDKRNKIKNTLKKILGILLASTPIDLALIAIAIEYGLIKVLIVIGAVAFLVMCVMIGAKLFVDGFDDE